MKGTIKTGLTRTYALRQYENIKPSIEIEVEFDTKEENFDMKTLLNSLKRQCDEYIEKYNPRPEIDDSQLPF